MIAVSNTTPLRYLIAINHEHLLGSLFERVFLPDAVYEELTDVGTPENVRRRISSPPAWLEVRKIPGTHIAPTPTGLHRGEREAILLAETLIPDVLLIDEQFGRSIALRRNIPISGTLGVLERADTIGLLRDFPDTLRQLKLSGFYVAEPLTSELLKRHERRKNSK